MSAVGDYIHWHRSRYNKLGTLGGNSYGPSSSPSVALQNQRQKFHESLVENRPSLTEEQRKKLTDFYQNLIYEQSKKVTTLMNKDDNTVIFEQEVREMMKEIYNMAVEDGYTNASIKMNDGNLFTKSISERTGKMISSNTRSLYTSQAKDFEKARTTIGAIIRDINQLTTQIKEAQELINSGDATQNTLLLLQQNIINSGTETLEKLDEVRKIAAKSIGRRSNVKNFTEEESRRAISFSAIKDETGIDFREIQKRINIISSALQGNFAFLYAGDSFEMQLAAANFIENQIYVTAGQTVQDFYKEIKSDWTGNTPESNATAQLSASLLVGENKNILEQTFKHGGVQTVDFPESDATMILNGPKGTVDTIIRATNTNDIGRLLDAEMTLNASLKNYSSTSNGIKLISKTNLATLLLTYFNVDFINHYLNLVGSHPYIFTPELSEASDLIDIGLVLRSLRGTKNNNDLFIVNDRGQQQITILTTSSIGRAILDGKHRLEEYFVIDKERPDYNIINRWHGEDGPNTDDAYARIATLIADLHKIKLSATMRASGFNSFK